MPTSASNSGRGQKISLPTCLPSNRRSWRHEEAHHRLKHNSRVNKKYGRRVLIVGFVLYLLWSNWNWSTVKDLPGVSTVVKWWSQAPLPKADPRRFAIALAHLEK